MENQSQNKLKIILQETKLYIEELKSQHEKNNNSSETFSSINQDIPSVLTGGLNSLADYVDVLLNNPSKTSVDTDIYIIEILIELFFENKKLRKDFDELRKSYKHIEQNLDKINQYITPIENRNNKPSLKESSYQNENTAAFNETEISIDEEFGQQDPQIVNYSQQGISGNTKIPPKRNFLQFLYSSHNRYQGEIYDTKTIHMCAITAAFKYNLQPSIWTHAWSWILTFVSLLTIFMQVLLLFPLVNEVTRSNCVMHSDCNNGLFCNGIDSIATWRQPRCYDCSLINWDEACPINTTLPSWILDVEQYTQNMWFDTDFTPYIDLPSDFLVNSTTLDKDLLLKCLGAQYCKTSTLPGMSTISDSTCPFLKLHLSKRSIDQILSFLCVSILFASLLSFDLKEAEIEDSLLDFAISSLRSQGKDILYSAYFIRLANRMRRFILPFLTTSAGASIIISEEFSSKNILLNLISILFVNEADNLLGALFSPSFHDTIADELMQSAKCNGVSLSPVWSINFYGLMMSTMMFVICTWIQPFTNFLFPNHNCFGITDSIFIIQFVFPGVSVIIYRVMWIIFFDKSPHKIAKSFLELTRMCTASALFMIYLSSVYYMMSPSAFFFYPPISLFASLFASVGAGIRSSFILKNSIKRSLKNYVIDIIIIAGWVGTHYWVISNLIVRSFYESDVDEIIPPFFDAT